VIEIASDSDPGLDLREKLPRYREAGIEEIWLLNPFEKTLRVETKDAKGYTSRTLTSGRPDSRVVPGFWVEVHGSGVRSCRRRSSVCARSSDRPEQLTMVFGYWKTAGRQDAAAVFDYADAGGI
jgi:Putative restriction endonuclease